MGGFPEAMNSSEKLYREGMEALKFRRYTDAKEKLKQAIANENYSTATNAREQITPIEIIKCSVMEIPLEFFKYFDSIIKTPNKQNSKT